MGVKRKVNVEVEHFDSLKLHQEYQCTLNEGNGDGTWKERMSSVKLRLRSMHGKLCIC